MLLVGQNPRYDLEVRNDAKQLVDATVVAVLVKPDGSTTNLSVVHDGTGLYHVNALLDVDGRLLLNWTVTGAVTNYKVDVLDVASGVYSIIGLDDAKDQLNMSHDVHDNDDELQLFVESVTADIEFACGAVVPREYTDVVDGTGAINLPHYPVLANDITITSVYGGGPSWATADLLVNRKAGIIKTASQGGLFYGGPFEVTYTAGRDEIPPALQMACRIIVQHLWKTQRGGSGRSSLGGGDTTTMPGQAYAIPNRAAELMEPYVQSGGFA